MVATVKLGNNRPSTTAATAPAVSATRGAGMRFSIRGYPSRMASVSAPMTRSGTCAVDRAPARAATRSK